MTGQKLGNGDKVAVIGGGPAGSFFAYFLLDLAERAGLSLQVDLYERREFNRKGPAGCNHCGGIVSESLVQNLAAAGINLPQHVIQCAIDSYVMHTDTGSVRLNAPSREKRIVTMYRGGGPLDSGEEGIHSFDSFLLQLAATRGARLVQEDVQRLERNASGLIEVTTRTNGPVPYALLAGTTGVNAAPADLLASLFPNYTPPTTTKTFIGEFVIGRDKVREFFGRAMHVFLLDIPRLDFAALIPKGGYVTACLLGEGIDKELVSSFLRSPAVRACFPPDWDPDNPSACRCYPKINLSPAAPLFADRCLLIGDCGATRLYKDGIGSAFITARAAASTAVLQGTSAANFHEHYRPACRRITADNRLGKRIFAATRIVKRIPFVKRAILNLAATEQRQETPKRRMSAILWDIFTGSSSYSDIVRRGMNASFLATFARETLRALFVKGPSATRIGASDSDNTVGQLYKNGEIIVREGDPGDCLYVIQSGHAVVLHTAGELEIQLGELGPGDSFGEMALFEREPRSATVKAVGEVHALTVDRRGFLKRIQEDPAMAFRILEKMSARVRMLNRQMARVKAACQVDTDDGDALPASFEPEHGVQVVALRGRLDTRTDAALTSTLRKALDSSEGHLLLDLAGVEFLSSSGLRALMLASEQAGAAGRKLAIAGAQPRVNTIFKLTESDKLLHVFKNNDEAMRWLSPGKARDQ